MFHFLPSLAADQRLKKRHLPSRFATKFNPLFLLLFCCFAPLFAQEEIRVHLTTESPLISLYLGRIEGENTPLLRGYLNQLQSVLEFDLKYNGITNPVTSHHEKEKLLWDHNLQAAFDPAKWKDLGIAFVFRIKVEGKALKISVLDVQKSQLKQFENIPLTGELS